MNYGSELESSAESGRFGDVGANIPVKLTKEELRELSTVKPWLACAHIAAEWALIAATIYLCQRFWHPMLYVFAVAFIGSRQHALLVLMHDGVHYRLLQKSAAERLDFGSSAGLAASGDGAAVSQESFRASQVP